MAGRPEWPDMGGGRSGRSGRILRGGRSGRDGRVWRIGGPATHRAPGLVQAALHVRPQRRRDDEAQDQRDPPVEHDLQTVPAPSAKRPGRVIDAPARMPATVPMNGRIARPTQRQHSLTPAPRAGCACPAGREIGPAVVLGMWRAYGGRGVGRRGFGPAALFISPRRSGVRGQVAGRTLPYRHGGGGICRGLLLGPDLP
jgi:hypothetical protein